MYWVYVLLCEDGSLYTGFTDDIKKRVNAHFYRKKSAAKYTKSHKVCEIAAAWTTSSESAARKLEFRIKRLDRAKKLLLIEDKSLFAKFFPELGEFDISPFDEIKLKDCI